MQKAFIMIGVPGSGKSTWAEEHLHKDFDYIFSSDAYRKKLYNDENIQSKNKDVFKTLYNDMQTALEGGHNICFDATNVARKERKKFVDVCKKVNEDIELYAIILLVNREVAIDRDRKRERHVGEQVIDKFLNRYEDPSIEEGFNVIFYVL